jgi:Flp pilus assembly protein TadG
MIRSRRDNQRGQILVLFVVSLVAMFAMLGLLLDGGHALALRRQLQDAGDAGALAAVNGLVSSGSTAGCSPTAGTNARPTIIDAATAAVQVSLPNLPVSSITVTCVAGQDNSAVQVNLNSQSPGFFGGILGMHGFQVGTTSQAINGKGISTKFSVVELDPSTTSWPNTYRGCPSLLFSGSNNVIFDGSVQVDSDCMLSDGGALSSNGSSAIVQVNNGGTINLVGANKPRALTIVPTPQESQPYVKDPLLWLPPVPWASWPSSGPGSFVRASSQTTLSGGSTVLEPGIYVGGIAMKNFAVAYLHPGIYVLRGAANGDGGFQMGAGNKVYSIPSAMTSTTDANWPTDCTRTNCGVLIYNTGMTSSAMGGGSIKDNISVGAGATLKLRPYLDVVDGTPAKDDSYNNLLIWQDASPVPSNSYAQPPISLSGGGQIDLSGTLYAPSALVDMGGTSGGAGGDTVNVTLQFISWDLKFSGNIAFHFFYSSDAFPKLKDYGLIK